MRILMALLTLGAGGAGYAYLQQPSVTTEVSIKPTTARLSAETGKTLAAAPDLSRGSVKELLHEIHHHTKTVLDDFANQHGGHSDAPSDNAFQRLKQVTKLTEINLDAEQRGTAQPGVAKELSARNRSNAHPAKLDELQRVAFDPAAVVVNPHDQGLDPLSANSSSENAVATSCPDGVCPIRKPESIPQALALNADRDPLDPATSVQVVSNLIENTSTNSVAPNPETPNPTSRRDAAVPQTLIASQPPTTPKPNIAVTPLARPRSPAVTTRTMVAAEEAQANKRLTTAWKIVGKTTERRPIHAMHLGTTGTRTLVIAGIDGQDRIGVRWLEQLAETMASHPELLNQAEVMIIRAGNPDGLVRNMPNNPRGVPLNRNFPSRRYRPAFGLPTFATPASEMETRVMLDALYSFRPRRVIHLVATRGPSQILYNRPAKEVAELLEGDESLSLRPLDLEQVPGSLEDFADGTLEAAVLSIRLQIGSDWQTSWVNLQPQVLATVIGRRINSAGGETVAPIDPDRTPLPLPSVEPISRRKGHKRYEELPTPPQR